MNDYMLLIKADRDAMANKTQEELMQHVEKVGAFIQGLREQGKIKLTAPLDLEGAVVSKKKGLVIDGPFTETKEIIAGFYLIVVETMEEAISIAKADPRFEEDGWQIEVRPSMKIPGINA